MQLTEFLPFRWPLVLNPFVLFGLLVLVGLLTGELARRAKLPTITGFLLIGFLLGPSVAGVFGPELLVAAKPITNVALALVLFQIGRMLDLRQMAHDPALLWTSLAECTAGFLLVYGVLAWLLGVDPLASALVAAIGVSSSPAVLYVIAAELGASGPLTDRAFRLVAINNVVAFLAYTALLPVLIAGSSVPASDTVLAAVWQILGALLLAWALTRLKLLAARWVGASGSNQFALSLAMVVFALGMATMLGLSLLLSLLALGILSRNLDRSELLVDVRFGDLSSVFFVTLFVTSGANLHADELVHAWYAVLAFALARIAGKWLGAAAATLATGGDRRMAALAGLPLVPMAALAIGLVDMTQDLAPQVGAELGAIVLGAIVIFETLGPVVTALAIRSAGEVPADAKLEH